MTSRKERWRFRHIASRGLVGQIPSLRLPSVLVFGEVLPMFSSYYSALRLVLGSVLLLPVTSAVVSRAVAAPPTKSDEKSDKPLFTADLPDDAAIARALREHYTKYEYRIPMRDGARLYTIAYVPKDAAQTYPLLMTRTPYSVDPYGVDNYPSAKTRRITSRIVPSTVLLQSGYIFVQQDVRGRMMSEGSFVDVRPHLPNKKTAQDIDESSDSWDTLDFLVKNVPNNNGKAGIWGISYPGFYAAQAAIDAHPALKAVSPQAPVTDWFAGDDFHHNGALFLADAFLFYSNFGKPRPKPTTKASWDRDIDTDDAYDFFLKLGPLSNCNTQHLKGEIPFWNDLMRHPNFDDFWKVRNPRPHYRGLKSAVMTVGGWFDAEDLFGALATYRSIEAQNPGIENTLVMGPWAHGGWARTAGDSLGDIQFGAKTGLYYRDKILAPFFERHLKDRKPPAQAEAHIFETGTNQWRAYDSWPPRGASTQTLLLQGNGKLGAKGMPSASATEADSYLSDPAKPVPFLDKISLEHGDYMNADQRFASRRPDVLTYVTEELASDVTLAGPVRANLWVSTTGTDADFVVKIIDVYPSSYPNPEPNPHELRMGGYQQLVRGEIMRGRYRNSLEKPEPFVPGQVTQVAFSLPDISHTFRTGHRMMVQIQSSWFPLVDRNPQTFVDIYHATEADFRTATMTVHRSRQHQSGIQLTVGKGTLPEK